MKIKPIISDCFYHVFNKSIANFAIFKYTDNIKRFLECLDFYNNINLHTRLSFVKQNKTYKFQNILIPKNQAYVKILSYCIMPDHFHLLIKSLSDKCSYYFSNVENSYSRFFNIKFKRKGPLWQSRIRHVRIRTDEQLMHVSRYIHLNPTTNLLVRNPEDWKYSSYRDLISDSLYLTHYLPELNISDPSDYRKFVENNKDYQIALKKIKRQLLD